MERLTLHLIKRDASYTALDAQVRALQHHPGHLLESYTLLGHPSGTDKFQVTVVELKFQGVEEVQKHTLTEPVTVNMAE